MTANARRYSRWCREHFETPGRPEQVKPAKPADKTQEPKQQASEVSEGIAPAKKS
ncbi:MAG TPA: hypothetical protein VG674_22070 [Amycolatopsis sp.]|nr:hypothetical protein [Amycolatopsis sp.]